MSKAYVFSPIKLDYFAVFPPVDLAEFCRGDDFLAGDGDAFFFAAALFTGDPGVVFVAVVFPAEFPFLAVILDVLLLAEPDLALPDDGSCPAEPLVDLDAVDAPPVDFAGEVADLDAEDADLGVEPVEPDLLEGDPEVEVPFEPDFDPPAFDPPDFVPAADFAPEPVLPPAVLATAEAVPTAAPLAAPSAAP